MASLKRRMVQWIPEGSELMHIDLNLEIGEKRVIAVFQDESSFHVNEFKKTTWCVQYLGPLLNSLTFVNRTRPEQQKLMKKGRGRIIYVSDFVEEENGCLIIRN